MCFSSKYNVQTLEPLHFLFAQALDPHYHLPPAKKEREKDILRSFKRPKWPIRPNKILHLKRCLVYENKPK